MTRSGLFWAAITSVCLLVGYLVLLFALAPQPGSAIGEADDCSLVNGAGIASSLSPRPGHLELTTRYSGNSRLFPPGWECRVYGRSAPDLSRAGAHPGPARLLAHKFYPQASSFWKTCLWLLLLPIALVLAFRAVRLVVRRLGSALPGRSGYQA